MIGAVMSGLGALVLFRVWAVLSSPLELGVDEAQYWLWGQNLQLGYYSKPPLIGWLLGLTDALFGGSAAATRIAAPFLHLITGLLLFSSARHLGGIRAGALAGALWLTLPAVSLASFVMSTDSLLLVFWSAALYCLIRADRADGAAVWRWMLLCGMMVGLGLLAKYAAVYFIIGMAGYAVMRQLRGNGFTTGSLFGFTAGLAAASAPTWAWNLANRFVTVRHLGENANLSQPGLNSDGLADFWAAQAGVLGPTILIMLAAAIIWGRASGFRHSLLGWFIWPAFAVISVQALLKEANANWAVAAAPAAILWISVISATAIGRWWRMLAGFSIGLNLMIALIAGWCFASGSLGIFTPKSDPLRRLKGWEVLASDVRDQIEAQGIRAVIAHNRATAALLYWHFGKEGYLAETGIEIVMEPGPYGPGNHYEREYPLTSSTPRPVLALTDADTRPSQLFDGWEKQDMVSRTQISARRMREVHFWMLR